MSIRTNFTGTFMDQAVSITNNERLILDIVRRNEPIIRSSIADQSPFTQPGVHRIINSLVEQELVVVGEARANGPGKPSPLLHLDRTRHYSLGIEVNTDAIDVCLANTACEPVAQTRITTDVSKRSNSLRSVRERAMEMLQSENRTEKDLIGVCLGISGFFVNGQVNTPEPLEDWSLIDLHKALADYFRAPTWVANNATTAAIGESLIGIGRTSPNFAYLSFNYGFGGGVIVDGKPYFGANGNALEISAIYTDEESQDRPALQYLLAELNKNGISVQTIEQLQKEFDPMWPGVEAWIERTLPQLNRALRAILSTLDPEYIVFGGEIPQQLAETLIDRASLRGSPEPRYQVAMPVPELIYAQAAQVGPALGAAMLPLKALIYV